MVSSSVPHIAGYPLGLNLYGGYHQQPDFQFSASHEGHFNQGTSHHGNFVNGISFLSFHNYNHFKNIIS